MHWISLNKKYKYYGLNWNALLFQTLRNILRFYVFQCSESCWRRSRWTIWRPDGCSLWCHRQFHCAEREPTDRCKSESEPCQCDEGDGVDRKHECCRRRPCNCYTICALLAALAISADIALMLVCRSYVERVSLVFLAVTVIAAG